MRNVPGEPGEHLLNASEFIEEFHRDNPDSPKLEERERSRENLVRSQSPVKRVGHLVESLGTRLGGGGSYCYIARVIVT